MTAGRIFPFFLKTRPLLNGSRSQNQEPPAPSRPSGPLTAGLMDEFSPSFLLLPLSLLLLFPLSLLPLISLLFEVLVEECTRVSFPVLPSIPLFPVNLWTRSSAHTAETVTPQAIPPPPASLQMIRLSRSPSLHPVFASGPLRDVLLMRLFPSNLYLPSPFPPPLFFFAFHFYESAGRVSPSFDQEPVLSVVVPETLSCFDRFFVIPPLLAA